MKRRIKVPIILSFLLVSSVGCQAAAKKYGGEMTVDLPKGEKLVNITWKDDSLWYLTRPMAKNDKEETYKFTEDSNWGVLEGTVTIKERKK